MKMSDILKNGLIEEVPKLLDKSERENKMLIYSSIADFIQKKAHIDFPLSLRITYLLCGEDDEEMLKADPISPEAVQQAEEVREFILAIKVHYERAEQIRSKNKYRCETEIYFLEGGNPMVTRIEKNISYEDFPNQIREYMLRTGENTVSVKLFPQGA